MVLSDTIIILIIVFTLTADLFLSILADSLNLKRIQFKIPKEFRECIDPGQYKKSQDYLKAGTTLNVITSLFGFVLILSFWFLKGFAFTDALVRSWNFHPVTTGLFYIGLLLFMNHLILLPFSIYTTFVIEDKFGFNKTTPAIFVIDLMKSMVLTALLGGIFLFAILTFLEHAGPAAWLMCWAVSALFILGIHYVAPTLILPLFNKFTPLESGDLKDAITGYAKTINFNLENIYVMDGSKRSLKSNAFFIGFGKNRRIVLYDTLIKENSITELVAVLAHEMGHYKKKHVLKRTVAAIMQMGVLFFLLSLFISSQGLYDAFFMDQPSTYAGLIFFGMLYSPIDLFLSMAIQAVSRKDEYEADRFAADTLKDKEALVRALKNLSVQNLSNLTPHPFYVFLNYSHPPVMDRIRAIRSV